MQTSTEVSPLIDFTERVRAVTRKNIDKIFKIMKKLNKLTGDVPVYYSVISTEDTDSDNDIIQRALNHYIHNTNNNSLIIASAKMYNRDTFLMASIGKPLPLPNHMPILEKIIRNVDHHIRIGNYNLTVDNLKDTINDLMLNDNVRITNGFSDYNSKLIITYSRLIYNDRDDFNFNVDDDYNHYRLIDVEKMLLKSIE